ncbi:metallophosphoesterase [Anaerosporobacter sp.]
MVELIWVGIIIVLFVFLMHKEIHHLTVSKFEIHSDKIPVEFDRAKVVLLTDLHNNTFGENNEDLLRRIRNEHPDYIMIAGDMLVGHKKADYYGTLNFLKVLSEEFTIYYVNGNHEQRLAEEKDTKDTIYKEYHDILEANGIHFVHNRTIKIKRKDAVINVTGLEIASDYYNKFNRPAMTNEYIETCIGKCNPKTYNILLAHNPMYFDYYVQWGADLVLSGHVHGGVMRLPFLGGVISPQYILFPRFDSGRFEEGSSTMLLSRGLGVHTLKIRIFNRPEMMVFTLNRDE